MCVMHHDANKGDVQSSVLQNKISVSLRQQKSLASDDD